MHCYLPITPPAMPPHLLLIRPHFFIFRQQDLLSSKLPDAVAAFILNKRIRNQHPVIIAQGDQPPVESAVQVGAQCNSVGNGIVVADAEGNNVAGIHHGNIYGCIHPESGNTAGIVVNFWHFALKNAAAHKYLFLVGILLPYFVFAGQITAGINASIYAVGRMLTKLQP